jgi:hypothetical protein
LEAHEAGSTDVNRVKMRGYFEIGLTPLEKSNNLLKSKENCWISKRGNVSMLFRIVKAGKWLGSTVCLGKRKENTFKGEIGTLSLEKRS